MSIFAETIAELNALTGPQTAHRIAAFAAAERDAIIEAQDPSLVVTTVDGRTGAALESVDPEKGMIVFQFSYAREIAQAIHDLLVSLSPFRDKRTGANPPTHYEDEHLVFVNGQQVEQLPEKLGPADTVMFVNVQPYARKIEAGFSLQAPKGVYEQVARIMRDRFGNAAGIDFSYQQIPGTGPKGPASRRGGARSWSHDDNFPALTVTVFAE